MSLVNKVNRRRQMDSMPNGLIIAKEILLKSIIDTSWAATMGPAYRIIGNSRNEEVLGFN